MEKTPSKGFTKIPNWLLKDDENNLDAHTKLLLCVLASYLYVGGERKCNPSLARLQRLCCCGKVRLLKSIDRLERLGLIKVYRQHKKTNVYILPDLMKVQWPPKRVTISD